MTQKTLIDWHTHVWLPEHHSPELWAEKQRIGQREADPQSHRKAMEYVDKYVIIGIQWDNLGESIPNDFIAQQVAESDGRALGFACVHPLADGAEEELRRSIQDLKLSGLKLSPTYQVFDPRADEAWKLYEIANELQIPVMFHSGGAYPSQAALEHSNPVLLDPVARHFPELKIIVAHLGQPWMAETVMLMRKHENVFSDLSARFHRPWQLYNGLVLALEYKVESKLLFGTDFPVRTPEQSVTLFQSINDMLEGTKLPRIPESTIQSILYERPFSLLGL